MLDGEALERIRGRKSLLAFSGGVDSTALYHLLKELKTDFDIATVNYCSRAQSVEEENYAKELAARDNRRLYLHRCSLSTSDFERRAREERYRFFEKIIREEGYENLITAHQLDDMLEWGLMQLCKGCGTVEFVGMRPVEEREGYFLVRPLLFTPKKRLLDYLEERGIKYFFDESNLSPKYTRNRFRKEAASFLMRECADGVARSFRYMLKDKEILAQKGEELFRCGRAVLLRKPDDEAAALRLIDSYLKKSGYLLSAAQKEEILKQRSVVVGGEWAVDISGPGIWIAPYSLEKMPKDFKELCRRLKIPPKVRPYLLSCGADEEMLSSLPF
ncbi:tRNA(Ile)-lysidine synthetase [Hydrogenimonas sp.]|nr:tRNA(Ile)-lysidine synthetase [Hydrogenimonas sp.]